MKKILSLLFLSFLSSGCSVFFIGPRSLTTSARDQMFPTNNLPLEKSVTVYWDKHRIPFIEAATDHDLAFTIGLVHAHLRLAQLELFRYASQGRLSELAGPFAVDFDKTIRIFDFGRAAPEIIQSLPQESLTWVTRYRDGINFYIGQLREVPPDLRAMDIKPQPWTLEEIVTLWRLAATDVNWIYYFSFLMLQDKAEWKELWKTAVENGLNSTPSFTTSDLNQNPGMLPWFLSKSGSNSIALSADKTRTGSALIANDPHLGIFLPNVWLLIGYKSPSYHAVGLAIPGTPFIALGRNPDIAWGGTNMRALSTFLYELEKSDVSDLPVETEDIAVRFWFDSSVERRFSPWGPVLSDSPLFETKKPVAIKWVGHDVSDELTAFLKMNRARNWNEFRNAFETYAVSAQNFLYADVQGNIGHVLAFRQPVRRNNDTTDLLNTKTNPVVDYKNPLELPFIFNPVSGFIASANNKPTMTESEIGWFYSANDRIDRLNTMLTDSVKFGIDDMKKIQQDVFAESSFNLSRLYISKLDSIRFSALNEQSQQFYNDLRSWDGYYDKGSSGALAFELLNYGITTEIFNEKFKDEDIYSTASQGGLAVKFVSEDINHMNSNEFTSLAIRAFRKIDYAYAEFKTWGDMHEMQINHILANIPLIGSKWKFDEYPVEGSSETLHKTASRTTTEKNRVFYGANSRHISDLSDMDENYFVLLGGQDGWMTSEQTLDQVQLWRNGEYIHFPLRIESIKKKFNTVMTLQSRSDLN